MKRAIVVVLALAVILISGIGIISQIRAQRRTAVPESSRSGVAGGQADSTVADPQTGQPLIVQDQHRKKLKYQVIARDGYKAKNEVE